MTESKNQTDIFLDFARPGRNGFAETIFCRGKTFSQIRTIVETMAGRDLNILGTHVDPSAGEELAKLFQGLIHDPVSRTIRLARKSPEPISGIIGVLAGGTSDLPVAEEAAVTSLFYGVETKRFYDIGVAGLHRLFSKLEEIKRCDVLIVVAGMEGALPSVVGGLVSQPIIACPTSIGYGTHLQGFTPLAAMLNSCAEGISVVNVDNGFGAACCALRILRKRN
ncbi:MAG: nickel pincer cofactor biosynthesis protein LarB [Deltaproteobacteria bacterium]|nr:nickel pincer cofactor biosynthesis protein LarB [Deltaproteobacteria bacterium]